MKLRRRAVDCGGRRIDIGDEVRVARCLGGLGSHPEFRRAFRRVAGRLTTVVGWDSTGGAWIPVHSREVLTIEPHLLRLVRRGVGQHARAHVGA